MNIIYLFGPVLIILISIFIFFAIRNFYHVDCSIIPLYITSALCICFMLFFGIIISTPKSSSYIVESVEYESYETYMVTVSHTDYLHLNFYFEYEDVTFSVPASSSSKYFKGQEFSDLDSVKNFYMID